MKERSPRVERMRVAFDESFARAPAQAPETIDLLTISFGGTERVVLLQQVAQVIKGAKIVSVPSRAPALAGVVGIRGAIVPVFSIAALLQLPEAELQYLLLLKSDGNGQAQIAFSCESVSGFLRVPREKVDGVDAVELKGGTRYALLDLKGLMQKIEAADEGKRMNG